MELLYKYLTEKSHAESFISGNLFFTNLAEYILTEDITRKDIEDGYFNENFGDEVKSFIVKIREDDIVLKTENYEKDPKHFFVLCVSLGNNLFEKFRCKYAVKINNPFEFSKRLNDKFGTLCNCKAPIGEGVVNYYNTDNFKKIGIINGAFPLYKRNNYIEEFEYRYFLHKKNLFIRDNRNEKNGITYDLLIYKIQINIGTISDICEIIKK